MFFVTLKETPFSQSFFPICIFMHHYMPKMAWIGFELKWKNKYHVSAVKKMYIPYMYIWIKVQILHLKTIRISWIGIMKYFNIRNVYIPYIVYLKLDKLK